MQAKTLQELYPSWSALEAHREFWAGTSLQQLFKDDRNRAARHTVSAAGLELDYSKNHINDETLKLLLAIAKEANLESAIQQLLSGATVNNTENRPALHTALRFTEEPQTAEQQEVAAVLEKIESLVEAVHSKTWVGFSGDSITDVVNIGIGGSDLGPRMVTQALKPYHTGHVKVHFIANVDGSEIYDLIQTLNPRSTLFLIASKSFATLETLENALSARQWMLDAGCVKNKLARHFIAISSKVDKAVEFGIAAENVYPLWDWVGGRYSLWSAIGLPIAFAIGMENFNLLRAGGATMDEHFGEAPLEKNLPVLMALVIFWYSQLFGTQTQAVLPYAHHLQYLPAYLQQLEMESNGKSVTREGSPVGYPTGSIVWGTEGTNGQHSFHQLLHQGTSLIPVDFIAILQAQHPYHHQHRYLYANCVAQSQALLSGRDLKMAAAELRTQGVREEDIAILAPHKVHPGNRPSNTIIMETLKPETLGALIAAYEHKVYTLGVLLNINSYDQWGVELGKLLGTHIATAIETTDIPGDWDSSTKALVKRFNNKHTTL